MTANLQLPRGGRRHGRAGRPVGELERTRSFNSTLRPPLESLADNTGNAGRPGRCVSVPLVDDPDSSLLPAHLLPRGRTLVRNGPGAVGLLRRPGGLGAADVFPSAVPV